MTTVKQPARTMSEHVLDIAESQVGRHEHGGANRGDCEIYQRFYGEFYVGKAWCGCFVGWVWESWRRSAVAARWTISSGLSAYLEFRCLILPSVRC